MGNKFVSLDDKRNTLEIEVSGKKFAIVRMTIEAQQLAKEYFHYASLAAYKTKLYSSDISDITIGKDVSKAKEQITKKTEEFTQWAVEAEEKIFQYQQDIIKKILTDNDIKFDSKFWAKEVDAGMPDLFIQECLAKDGEPKKSPVKK